jgi:probable F420-dependent oxidoreductase
VKVRIGYGLGVRSRTNDQERFGALVDDLERLDYDSLWLSDRVSGDSPDPVVAMAFAAGRTRRLKFGMSVMVLPGRNPILVAKAMASLDRLSAGRLLPAFGLGVADPHEQQAYGVERADRAPWFDEALPLLRRFWEEDVVDHDGDHFQYKQITVLPKPVQQPIDVWMGGAAPSELRRVGRLADGWLPSYCTPADVQAARPQVEEAAERAGRAIDPEHFGALVPYATDGELPDSVVRLLATRRPGADPATIVPTGLPRLREHLEALIAVGASKFVLVPTSEPVSWADELEVVAAAVLPLQV